MKRKDDVFRYLGQILIIFGLTVLFISVFAFLFGWFPVNMLKAWGSFFACFAAFAFASAYIMAWKTDKENKEMEEALKRLKEEQEENDGHCN